MDSYVIELNVKWMVKVFNSKSLCHCSSGYRRIPLGKTYLDGVMPRFGYEVSDFSRTIITPITWDFNVTGIMRVHDLLLPNHL